MYVAVLDTGATIEAGTAADSEKSPNARVYGAYGSPKGPPSPSAAAVSARRATFNSTQGSGHLAERLARLRAEHTAEEDELVHQLQEARASEEEICRNSEKCLLHAFIPEETIKTPISHTGVAAASSASSIRPQLVQTPRQRVPTEKMERLGIETISDVLESRHGGADWVKRKETETERAAEERAFVPDSRVFHVAGARASDLTSPRSPLTEGKMESKDDVDFAASPSAAAFATRAVDARYSNAQNEGFRLFPSGLLDDKLVSATIKEEVGSSLFELPDEDNSITESFNAATAALPLNYTRREMQSTSPAAGTVGGGGVGGTEEGGVEVVRWLKELGLERLYVREQRA